MTLCKIEGDWVPTTDNVNRLPEPLKKYIHDLIVITDPAGYVRKVACLEEQVRALYAVRESSERIISILVNINDTLFKLFDCFQRDPFETGVKHMGVDEGSDKGWRWIRELRSRFNEVKDGLTKK